MNAALTITIPADVIEQVVKDIMANFPEASAGCALCCIGWKYDEWRFRFEDGDSGKIHDLDKAKLLAAFPLMFTDKWPKGCTRPIASADAEAWNDWLCQADATDFDAFAQLACLGEVIYG